MKDLLIGSIKTAIVTAVGAFILYALEDKKGKNKQTYTV